MKKISAFIFAVLLCVMILMPCFADTARLNDSAALLSESEYSEVLDVLNKVSTENAFDVVIVTTNSIGSQSACEFADDYFDYNNFGIGANRDGCVLLLNITGQAGNNDWYVSTRGYGLKAIKDDGLEYLSSRFLPLLKSGDYKSTCLEFAYGCDEFVKAAKAGKPYTGRNIPKDINWFKWIGFSLLAGIAGGFIVTGVMKSKLKSVRPATEASNYVKSGSVQITARHDIYLFSNVTKTPRQTDNSSSHTSSSGASHGGGGGKF